jgi:menaquinone-dependent protoporphyrinogen IX oxidase
MSKMFHNILMYYKIRMDEEEKDNVIDTIIKLMEQTEKFIDKTGDQKKSYVMEGVKTILGDVVYERYNYFISMFIDFVINISKGKKLNLNKVKNKYYCC